MICKDASKLTREALEDDWVGLHELVAELPAGARTDRHEIENLKAQMPEAARPSGPWACLWLRPVSWPGIAASVPASPRRPHDGDGGQGKSAGWIWSQCPEIGRGGGPAGRGPGQESSYWSCVLYSKLKMPCYKQACECPYTELTKCVVKSGVDLSW